MTINEIRKKYLEFFKKKGHTIIPSASLIPVNDLSSVLFTTAGMQPLVPFLMGEKHPGGKRLTSVQKCLRTGDIGEIGDNNHLTFFEMLGNWSLGDYWKKEAIELSWEFLTAKKWLGLNPRKIAISVFKEDNDPSFDKESYNAWSKLGIPEKRIIKLGKNDNWWPAGGKCFGPQGPDTEIFYWTGEGNGPKEFNPNDDKWVEIWNNVFMEYERTKDGKYIPLKQKNVDTGMGLERTAAVMQGKNNVYEIDLFVEVVEIIKKLQREKDAEFKKIIPNVKSVDEKTKIRKVRILADHFRAILFLVSDGVVPGPQDRNYVLRNIIRRTIDLSGIEEIFEQIIDIFYLKYKDIYTLDPELTKKIYQNEFLKFQKTLKSGIKEFPKRILSRTSRPITIHAKDVFYFISTLGIPLITIKDWLNDEAYIPKGEGGGFQFEDGFEKKLKKLREEHSEDSKTASAGMFKGGLVDQSEKTIKYHTATHLLHQALKDVLGNHVQQKGSNITEKRLRFDFSHFQKLTEDEKKKVENTVTKKIKENLQISFTEMSIEEAKKSGAIGLFTDKYGEKIKVFSIGNYSKEICGGPHVENTMILGKFKIIKEEASSAGIRRIKAILE